MLPSTPKHARPARRAPILFAALGAFAILALAALVGTWVMGRPDPGGQATAGAAATAGLSDATTGPSAAPSPPQAGSPAPTARSTAPSPSATPSRTRVPAPAPVRTTARPPANPSFEDQVLTLVNQERDKAGCQAVTSDSRLVAAARGHSQDMATNNYFNHNTPSGVDPGTRITDAGYHWSGWGENIAKGQPDPASVMHDWMNSDGHRKNILNCGFRNLGVGLAYDGGHQPYWTQDFGTPA